MQNAFRILKPIQKSSKRVWVFRNTGANAFAKTKRVWPMKINVICTCILKVLITGVLYNIMKTSQTKFCTQQYFDEYLKYVWTYYTNIYFCEGAYVCLSGEMSLLTLDPTLIKCAVKLTLFIQFRWQLVWICRNGSSPPRYQIISHMFMHTLDI